MSLLGQGGGGDPLQQIQLLLNRGLFARQTQHCLLTEGQLMLDVTDLLAERLNATAAFSQGVKHSLFPVVHPYPLCVFGARPPKRKCRLYWRVN